MTTGKKRPSPLTRVFYTLDSTLSDAPGSMMLVNYRKLQLAVGADRTDNVADLVEEVLEDQEFVEAHGIWRASPIEGGIWCLVRILPKCSNIEQEIVSRVTAGVFSVIRFHEGTPSKYEDVGL